MKYVLALLLLPALAPSQDKVNPDSRILEDFSKRINAFLEVHKTARTRVHTLKPTSSPDEINRYERHLANSIRELRHDAEPGAIFTPEIAHEFSRLIQIALQSARSSVRQSLNHAEPVRVPSLQVNASYPEALPLQSTPPSFLMNLPHLPPDLE